MDKDKTMDEIFNLIAEMTKNRIEKEKETTLSEETYRMISLTQSLYSQVMCGEPTLFGGLSPVVTAD